MAAFRRLAFAVTAAGVVLGAAGAQSSSLVQQPASRPLTTQQIAAAAGGAVVTIVVFDGDGRRLGQGSGFIVRSDGVIITNWHVMAGASKATVTLKSGESFDRVSFLDGDKAADVVVLKVTGASLTAVQITGTVPEVGSRVVVLGSPLGLSGTVSEGIVSAIRLVDGRQLVQITAAISPGSSGGPVVDAFGRAFALATESIEGSGIQQLNFAVPVRYAMGLLGPELVARPLASSPAGVVSKRSDFAVSMAEYASWSRPDRTANPVSSLVGQYAFVSRTILKSTGSIKGKGLGILVLGNEVGLLASPNVDSKEFGVGRIGPLTKAAAGVVALRFPGGVFAGYQTDEGFWVSNESPENGEVVEMQTKKFSSELDEINGLYSVTCKTTSVGSFSVGGTAYPTRDDGPAWVGEAAVFVAAGQVHIDLLMKNSAGGNTVLRASGPLNGGRFELRDGTRRLAGTVGSGRLQGDWLDQRSANLRFEGPLRAERK